MNMLDHTLAFFLGLVIPVVGALQNLGKRPDTLPEPFDSREKIQIYWSQSALWWVLAGLVVFNWMLGGRTLAELGLTQLPDNAGWGLLLALLFLGAYALDTWWEVSSSERLAATRLRWRRDTPFMPVTSREISHSMVLVVTASITEEIAYRGFLIRYVAGFSGSTTEGLAVAVLVPALVFGVSHLYQGWRAVLKIILLAVVFGAILVVTQSLWMVIVLHFIVDLIGMLLGPKLLGQIRLTASGWGGLFREDAGWQAVSGEAQE